MCKVSLGILLFFLLLGSLIFPVLHNNIHAVLPGSVYRSAQLSPEKLAQVIQEDHLNSVINLRGENPAAPWYQAELAVAKQQHVALYNVRMAAFLMPTPAVFKQLVEVLLHAPRPLLIHCAGGSDRTGLASSVVLLLNNKSFGVAYRQVSIRFGAYRSDSVGKLVLPRYALWLRERHWQSSREHFLNWTQSIAW